MPYGPWSGIFGFLLFVIILVVVLRIVGLW
jgi:hypothetical protein